MLRYDVFIRHLTMPEVSLFLTFLNTISLVNSANWTYDLHDPMLGIEAWKHDCTGHSQSPIDISTQQVMYDKRLQLLDLTDYKMTNGVHMKLENHGGRTAEVIVSGLDLYLKGGSLPGNYKLKQFHFHWGKNNRRGSEHSLNGKYFPMEIHFVHKLTEAMNPMDASPKQLAVVAFLFKVGRKNDKYEQLLQYFDQIITANSEIHIPTFPIFDLLPADKRFHYFRYNGSLTTPPCHETVIWSVAIDKIFVSNEQLARFRSLLDENNQQIVDCFRPTQSVHSRAILTTKGKFAMSNGQTGNLQQPVMG